MPRLPRLDAPGVLHHVMGRGIEKRKIFLDDRDRVDFIHRLEELVKEEEPSVASIVDSLNLIWDRLDKIQQATQDQAIIDLAEDAKQQGVVAIKQAIGLP